LAEEAFSIFQRLASTHNHRIFPHVSAKPQSVGVYAGAITSQWFFLEQQLGLEFLAFDLAPHDKTLRLCIPSASPRIRIGVLLPTGHALNRYSLIRFGRCTSLRCASRRSLSCFWMVSELFSPEFDNTRHILPGNFFRVDG
jgi:hypothetical protein